MSLILKQEPANSIPTPPFGKGTLFLDENNAFVVKSDDGNYLYFPTVTGANTQVFFNDNGSLAGDADFTYNSTTGTLTVTNGNVVATGVKTDNLYYANGTAWDLSNPGGSNTQIQFNDSESFGGSAAFTFNNSSNLVTVSANLNANNLNATTHITSGNVWANSGTIGAQTLKGEGGNISNIQGANVSGAVSSATTAGTVTTAAQPNITSVGTLTDLNVNGNTIVGGNLTVNGNLVYVNVDTLAVEDPIIQLQSGPNGAAPSSNSGKDVGTALNYYDTQARVAFMGWDVSNVEFGLASQASITSEVVTFTSYGNLRVGNIIGNGQALSGIAGANVTGTVANATFATSAGSANTAGTVTTAAQPNITSVGTLSSLAVSGNANVGGLLTDNLYYANGTPWDLTQPAGSNTQIQYNDGAGGFGASANFTFDNAANLLTVSGNGAQVNIAANTFISNAYIVLGDPNFTSNAHMDIVQDSLYTEDGTGATYRFAGVGLQGGLQYSNGTFSSYMDEQGMFTSDSSASSYVYAYSNGYLTTQTQNGSGLYSSNVTFTWLVQDGNGFIANAAGGYHTQKFQAPQLVSNVATGTAPLVVTSTTQVANLNAATAGTVTTAAQPNITSVGTLASLAVTGNTTSGNFVGIFANGNSSISIPAANGNINLTAGGTPNEVVITNTGVNIAGTLNATGNANVGNIGAATAVITTGNITTINSGLMQNGTSNITVNSGGTVVLTNDGTARITATTAGANINGRIIATGNISGTQLISNIATGTAPLVVTSTTRVANLNVDYANVADSINVTAPGTGTGYVVFANATSGNVAEWVSSGITSNLANNSITATTFVGALSGAATSATTAGTVTTAAQPNITSIGTLTSLGVNGTVTAVAFTANTGVFTGNGSGLSAIAGANVTGTVASATTAGTVTTAAQPNITSVGTLTSLAVTGNATAGNVYANSGTIGASLLTGTLTTNAQPNITSVGTLTSATVTGNVAAGNLTTTGVLSVTGTGVSSIAGNLDMTSNTIINLATPTNDQDAATKKYVDDVAQGLNIHDAVQAATPTTLATITSGTITYNNGSSGVGANLTTTGSFNLIDGVNVQTAGTRILVKNEANAVFNGIYTWSNATVITRAVDYNTVPEVEAGDFVFVTGGTLYDNTGWVQTSSPTAIGGATDFIEFTQFSGAGTYTAGTGLTLTGSTFSVNASQTQVTSVGTLTGLNSSGTITAPAFTANTGVFTGNGSGLTAIAGGNVTGQVANALVAGTVYTAAQPNITSVGTLTSLSVTGNVSAGNVSGTLLTGTLTTAAQPNVTSLGTLTSLGVNGTVTAVNFTANTGVFTGNGSGLSAIAGANVTGTVSSATSATTAGTVTTAAQPNITSVGTLTSVAITGNATAGNVYANAGTIGASLLTGTLTTAAQPNITSVSTSFSGLTFVANAQITMSGAGSQISGVNLVSANLFSGNGSSITALNANNISSGTLAQARLANASLTVNGTAISLGGSGTITANTTQTLTLGSFLTGTSFNGGTAVTAAVDATSANTASKVVARDASGNFSAGTITATLSGAATSATTAGTVTTAAQPNITSVGTLTGLTLANASVISVGSNTNVGTFTGNFSLSAGSRLTATYADLAEKYAADATYESGTVLLFGGEHEVTLSTESDSTKVAGVVTTNPAYSMNSALEAEHVAEIALQGRVPVKVTGTITKGDLMVSASNGHATANNEARAGTIIGKALENFTGEAGVIEVAVGRF